MSCEDCLSRRAFLTKSTLAVAGVAALTAGCGDGQIGGVGATGPLPTGLTLKVSTVPALATVGVLTFHPTDLRVAIKRTGPASFLALSTSCTHEGTRIDIVNNAVSFECPNHGSRFDSDGNVTRGPNASGTVTRLRIIATTYDAATDILTIG
ncbi:MAG TPA: Rieske 2Fe-2S domain-containing protein [Gemmatimonadaceae bacterium]|nr:Rieske 2Fe-2S domain-containing protein [Gemmatimonadaceae bacterium]